MTTFKITYVATGKHNLDYVCISTCDYLNNGKRVANIIDAIESFEEVAETWELLKTKTQL